MSKTTLVILAAGIGSRYGGIKQLDAINQHGNTIIDFSLFDAIKIGFDKIVFVVREEIRDEFKSVFDEKLKVANLEIDYVNQEVDVLPKEFLPTKRTKPWGTGHALLMAKDLVNEKFSVINADDFYGRSAFEKIYNWLQKSVSSSNEFTMVGYRLENTLSENGSVSRGQCFVDDADNLERIIERTKIYRKGKKVVFQNEENSENEISPNEIVSMNFWAFTPDIFDVLENEFYQFLTEHSSSEKSEFFLPKVVNNLVEEEKVTVKVLKSEDDWMGVTYKADKTFVQQKVRELQIRGVYPEKLW